MREIAPVCDTPSAAAKAQRERRAFCAVCYRAFSARRDAQYCTPACRQKHYRHQKAAREVRKQVANLVASLIG